MPLKAALLAIGIALIIGATGTLIVRMVGLLFNLLLDIIGVIGILIVVFALWIESRK